MPGGKHFTGTTAGGWPTPAPTSHAAGQPGCLPLPLPSKAPHNVACQYDDAAMMRQRDYLVQLSGTPSPKMHLNKLI